MREVLFRGKRIDNGEWVSGSLITDEVNHAYIAQIIAGELVTFEVFPETVGQYTGRTDKKGTMIFEGDVVQLTSERSDYGRWLVCYGKHRPSCENCFSGAGYMIGFYIQSFDESCSEESILFDEQEGWALEVVACYYKLKGGQE